MSIGTVQNREEFLKNIAKQLGRDRITEGVKRPAPKHNVAWEVFKDASSEDLLSILKNRCQKIHTNVFETTKEKIAESLQEVIRECGGGSIIIGDDERFETYGLSNVLQNEKSLHIWNKDRGEENTLFAEQANIGIVFSEYTLAESGTITSFSSNDHGRAIAFLPNHLVAIIDKKTIVPRITQACYDLNQKVEKGELLPSSINFISGPSNSADIEMNLVVGVHGPIRATYIIV